MASVKLNLQDKQHASSSNQHQSGDCDYKVRLYFENGAYLSQVVKTILKKTFFKHVPDLFEGSTTVPEKDIRFNGHKIRVQLENQDTNADIIVVPYVTHDLKTLALMKELFKGASISGKTQHLVLGLHGVSEKLFKIKWPSHLPPSLKKDFESEFGSKPWKMGSNRTIPAEDGQALAQFLAAPFIEMDFDNESASTLFWDEVAQLTLYAKKKPHAPTRTTVDWVGWTLAGKANVPSFVNGTASNFDKPRSFSLRDDYLVVSDSGNHSLRKLVLENGASEVSTIAGIGKPGFQNGLGVSTKFNHPSSACFMPDVAILTTDCYNHVIRKVYQSDSSANKSNGQYTSTTYAGMVGEAGYLDGPFLAAKFNFPTFVEYYPADSSYLVCDAYNHVIRMLKDGKVTTFAGTGQPGLHDGPLKEASFFTPLCIRTSVFGSLILADGNNNCIRRLTSEKVVTICGSGKLRFQDGPAAQARFCEPSDAVEMHSGDIVITDRGNHMIRLYSSGMVTTIGGSMANTALEGSVFNLNLLFPSSICATKDNDLIISDREHHRILYISTSSFAKPEVTEFADWQILDLPIERSVSVPSEIQLPCSSDYSSPEAQMLSQYMLNSDTSKFAIDWLKKRLIAISKGKTPEKDLTRLLYLTNHRRYVRDKTFFKDPLTLTNIQQGSIPDNLKDSGMLLPSDFALLDTATGSHRPSIFTVKLSNQSSKFHLRWHVADDQAQLKNCALHVSPEQGVLGPSESTFIQVVCTLLDRNDFFHILKIISHRDDPPMTSYTPILISIERARTNYAENNFDANAPAKVDNADLGYWSIEADMLQEMSMVSSTSTAVISKASLYGIPVSVKRWDLTLGGALATEFEAELKNVIHLQHPQLIKFIGAKSNPESAWIVYELAERGSLDLFLRSAQPEEKSSSVKHQMVIDAAKGLKFLHDQNIIHGNIKSLNLLVTPGLRLKVSDYGSARVGANASLQATGPFDWMAPEVFQSQKYTTKSDVFSFGIVTWELLSESLPNRDLTQVAAGTMPPLKEEWKSSEPLLCKLISTCCANDPESRPSFSEVLETLKGAEKVVLDTVANTVARSPSVVSHRTPWRKSIRPLSLHAMCLKNNP